MSNIIAAAYEAWDEEIRKNNLATKNNDRQNARKRHYKNNNLEKEIHNQAMKLHTAPTYEELRNFALHFVEWQKEQIIVNTADATIGLPYENKHGGYTHLVDVSRPLPVGNNKIAIIFKEG